MPNTPHLDKLDSAIRNPKCEPADVRLLEEAKERYRTWKSAIAAAAGRGKPRVVVMTRLLNEYKDFLEVELIAGRGSAFIKRQKGQLKLDNSVLEEFLIDLTQPTILKGLPDFPLTVGPNTAFLSLSFAPPALRALNEAPVHLFETPSARPRPGAKRCSNRSRWSR
jgi:hypothetical protein